MQDGKSTTPEILPQATKIPAGVASKEETWANFVMYQ